jgi:hypothetical protein
MPKDRVFIVHLRRPRDRKDGRHDPFGEFGSFGITGCHSSNLMNPEKAEERLEGARLAFAQGGRQGTRLLYLTPPVHVELHSGYSEAKWITEVKWKPAEMPFRYAAAPILASNAGSSDFPQLEKTLLGNRETPEGQFASRFRSSARELNDPVIVKELIRKFQILRSRAAADSIAGMYDDALPNKLPSPDGKRLQTYRWFLKNPGGSAEELTLAAGYVTNRRRNRKLCKEFIHTETDVPDFKEERPTRRKC